MQSQEIQKITDKIKNKESIARFQETTLFNQFPEEIRRFLVNKNNNSLKEQKKYLLQALIEISNRFSNKELVLETAEYFSNINKPKNKRNNEPIIINYQLDDSDQLKIDLDVFFKKIIDEDDINNLLLIGWEEFFKNQGITCEVPLFPRIINEFSIENYQEKELETPTYNIIEPFVIFFNIISYEEIIYLLIGNALWKLSINFFNNKARYKILPHNAILIILKYYEGVLLIVKETKLITDLPDIYSLNQIYYELSERIESKNFLIEPWREYF
ncbi:MAG: hypothetical protein ACFFBP_20145 [Promethearchaeota archaeon]